jgi:ribosome modulation factor
MHLSAPFQDGRKYGVAGRPKDAGLRMHDSAEKDEWLKGWEFGYKERWSETVSLPERTAPTPSEPKPAPKP